MKSLIKIVLCCALYVALLCGCTQNTIVSKTEKVAVTSSAQKEVLPKTAKPVEDGNALPEAKNPEEEKTSSAGEKVAESALEYELSPGMPVDSPTPSVSESASFEAEITKTPTSEVKPAAMGNKIIVLDPGHGKSSSLMTDQEKTDSGYTYVQGRGWGEWRHFKSGTMWQDCEGSGCSGRAPQNGSCWYSIGSGDRNIEPDLNYNNAINAKKYLEQMGYTVRLTRGQNESPSITQRIKNCYPGGDTNRQPDAAAYVCIHANAGGGRGSCYIALSGLYDHSGKPGNYIEAGNTLGKFINDSIVSKTSMPMYGNGVYNGYPELVLFCKSPVPVVYLEIGFYDNATDLGILRNESDGIGKAIAEGVDAYFKS